MHFIADVSGKALFFLSLSVVTESNQRRPTARTHSVSYLDFVWTAGRQQWYFWFCSAHFFVCSGYKRLLSIYNIDNSLSNQEYASAASVKDVKKINLTAGEACLRM
jgi:hypothetical protein